MTLPPGAVRLEPLLRLLAGKTVVEGRTLFLGDGKGPVEKESVTLQPGSTLGVEKDFLTADKLKAGSVYITNPSLKFVFGPAGKAKPKEANGAEKKDKKAPSGSEVLCEPTSTPLSHQLR